MRGIYRDVAFVAAFAAALIGAVGCDRAERSAPPATGAAPSVSSIEAPAPSRPPSSARSARPALPVGHDALPTACSAPSLTQRLPIDGRDVSALDRCVELSTGDRQDRARCGQGSAEIGIDWQRLDGTVLAFDQATRAHVRKVADLGRELGRNRRAFGLVGDSMTVSGAFLRPFSASRPGTVELSEEARQGLTTAVAGRQSATIIDYYRGAPAAQVRGLWADSFVAPRAAKVGARSSWALIGEAQGQSPVALMVAGVSPAVAVAVYGGNDAAYRIAPPDEIAATFEANFGRVLDALEQRGVVPILSTIARHGPAPGLSACGRAAAELSNWRIAVQTNAVNAAVIRLACRRHLPLIDLRHALDGAPNHGLGPDGVHPSDYPGGAGVLTARGLQCGYNIRNYVTLRMLKQVKELLEQGNARSASTEDATVRGGSSTSR